MSPFTVFAVTVILFVMNAVLLVKGAILVPNETLREQNVPMEKISDDDRDSDMDKPAEEECAAEFFHQLNEKHSIEDDGFECFKGNMTEKSNIVYFKLRDYHKRTGESIRVEAEIYLKLTGPPSPHPFSLSLYDAMTNMKVSHAQVIPGVTRKWVVFAVDSVVRRWLRHPASNHGVRAVIETADPLPIGEERSEFGVPLLFIYTGYHPVPIRSAGRNRRSATEQPLRTENVSLPADDILACSRRDMFVNTRKVFGDWMLHPLSFNAYQCAGKCEPSFVYGRLRRGHFKNHEFIKHLLARNSSEPAESCCVPSGYKSQSMLFFNNEGNIVISRKLNIIVTECSCVYKNTIKTD